MSSIPGWTYYNRVAIPTSAPHEEPDLSSLKNGSIWSIDGKNPLFARYTTNWDCANNTGWWYCIKDTPFDITLLKTKRRYEITKSLRFFEVQEIDPFKYADELANVQEQAFSAYPPKYRPKFEKNIFLKRLEFRGHQIGAKKGKCFGAFDKQTGKLVGFAFVDIHATWVNFAAQRTIPKYEKNGLNAALVYGLLESFKEKISRNFYICDGSRSTKHETHFQDYLEKYFGFRKCYCELKLIYPFHVKFIISILYPFRRFISFMGRRIGIFHLISSVLEMEKISRKSS